MHIVYLYTCSHCIPAGRTPVAAAVTVIVAYARRPKNSPFYRTKRPRKTKIGTEVPYIAHVTRRAYQGQTVKGQGHEAALVGCAGRTTWTQYGDISICIHVYVSSLPGLRGAYHGGRPPTAFSSVV